MFLTDFHTQKYTGGIISWVGIFLTVTLVILRMPTIFQVIKESEISKLAIPWASSRVSWLMRGVHARMSQLAVDDMANKSVAPLSVDEVV